MEGWLCHYVSAERSALSEISQDGAIGDGSAIAMVFRRGAAARVMREAVGARVVSWTATQAQEDRHFVIGCIAGGGAGPLEKRAGELLVGWRILVKTYAMLICGVVDVDCWYGGL